MAMKLCNLGLAFALVALLCPSASARAADDTARRGNAADRHRSPFATVVIGDEQPRFTGEPISLSLKDADIKDVLRTFAELTKLNVVVDPSVSGTVTVELHDVPWDQALDLILRMNGLGLVLTKNVLYVAPQAKMVTVFPKARF